MPNIAFHEPDASVLARRAEIVAQLAEFVPPECLVTDPR